MSNCDNETDVKPSLWSGLVRWTKSCCYKPSDIGLNIYGALVDIATAIREHTSSIVKKGYTVACITFRIEGGVSLTNGALLNEILFRSSFNNKPIGFGASILNFPLSGGSSSNDDVLKVQLYDFTSGSPIGDWIVLTSAQKHGNITDDGNQIGNNIPNGHEVGIKIQYTNTDGGSFVQPDIDVFMYFEPNELTYTEE